MGVMAVTVDFFTGAAMRPYLPALARLRIAVFRAWPYLYDGELNEEQIYLSELARSPRGGLAVAFDGTMPVGCSTCLPLTDAEPGIQAPFLAAALDPGRYFYFGLFLRRRTPGRPSAPPGRRGAARRILAASRLYSSSGTGLHDAVEAGGWPRQNRQPTFFLDQATEDNS
jgi:hypothetical protein